MIPDRGTLPHCKVIAGGVVNVKKQLCLDLENITKLVSLGHWLLIINGKTLKFLFSWAILFCTKTKES